LYDAFFELTPQIIDLNNKKIKVTFYLNGNKDANFIQSDYIISNKNNGKYIKSYDSIYIPYELNILLDKKGNSFFLYDKQMFFSSDKTKQTSELIEIKRKFFRNSIKDMIKILIRYKCQANLKTYLPFFTKR
jgi:hypothetical protein